MFAQLPTISFICAALVLVPLPWHWRAGNVATITICGWLFVSNMLNGIDAILWGNTVESFAPVWCDISTKLQVGSNVALPAAMLCLCIHLERIASVRQVSITKSDKRRRQILDGVFCFAIPVVYMTLHYVVQGHRFDIVEGFGCRPTVYESIASVCLIWLPPMLFSVVGCIYAALAFVQFWRRRATFAKHLQNSNLTLNTNRYFRLMCLAIVEMCIGILVTSLNMWLSLRVSLRPWISWENVHSNWLEVAYFPLILIPKSTLLWTFGVWAEIPVASIVFFGFFAFGRDAMAEYAATLAWFRRNILHLRPSDDSLKSGSPFRESMRYTPALHVHGGKVQGFYPYTPPSIKSFGTTSTFHVPESIPSNDQTGPNIYFSQTNSAFEKPEYNIPPHNSDCV